MTKTEKRGVRGSGKVAFWARKESIKKMLDDKYSLMAIFLAHEKDIGISYGQFRIYVNEYIKEKPIKKKGPETSGQKTKDKELSVTEFYNQPTDKEDNF